MKSTFTLILALMAFAANAQTIPNANFETWTTDTWPITPIDWVTQISDAQEPVTQDLDAYEGDFAMRVTSQETGIGEFASATAIFDIDYIPASLDFYVKTEVSFGAVQVSIIFYDQDLVIASHDWFTSENIQEWTPVSIEMDQIDPIITHAEIVVSAQVGDLVAGDAIISVDAMGFGTTNGVDRIKNRDLAIYPNPASNILNIQSPENTIEAITFYNITGKIIYEQSLNTLSNKIDVSELPIGAYTVVATLKTGERASQKLLIVR